MTAYGNWPLRTFAELAEEAAQAKILRAEVEALRGELEAKNRILDSIADDFGPYLTGEDAREMRGMAESILAMFRKEEIDG